MKIEHSIAGVSQTDCENRLNMLDTAQKVNLKVEPLKPYLCV